MDLTDMNRRLPQAMTLGALCVLLPCLGWADAAKPATGRTPTSTGRSTASQPVLVKIDRPEKVGRTSQISIQSSNREVTETRNAAAQPEVKRIYEAGSLRGVREVLAVGKNGRATKLKLAIDSLTFTSAETIEPKELLAGGKVVIAELKNDQVAFTVDGKPAVAALDLALQSFGLIYEGPETDVLFNTKVPHAIGDTWSVNLAEVVKQDIYQSLTFDLKASSGKVTLGQVAKVDGIDCYRVTCEMTLIPSGLAGQDGANVAGSTVKFATTIPVPVDPSLPEVGCKTDDETTFKIRFKAADGTNSVINAATKAIRDEKLQDQKPAGK